MYNNIITLFTIFNFVCSRNKTVSQIIIYYITYLTIIVTNDS